MRADRLQLALRPRPMLEAADLGVRLAQSARPSLVRAYLPFVLALAVLCGCTMDIADWLPPFLFWWAKPWLDLVLLHVYARQAFGDATDFRSAWDARRRAPWGVPCARLTIGRLSPRRSYVLPVQVLEGSRGTVLRARLRTLLREHPGAATGLTIGFSMVEEALALALLSAPYWLTSHLPSFAELGRQLVEQSKAATWATFILYVVIVTFVEPFYVAAGFAMYLNRRVELEAWDVEQELRDAFAPA